MKQPPCFVYNQSNLQDFTDCPRRFQLRYLMEQAWPAPPAEPLDEVERADRLGRLFHRLVERHWLGLPIQREQVDPALVAWWDAFVQNPPALPGTIRRPELHTSAVVHDQRMAATFDLVAYDPGGDVVIVDWKTSHHKPPRAWLDRRMQTVIYPLLLVESASRLIGFAVKPEQVKLIYWFANAPTQIEVFQYNTARYETDKRTVAALLDRLLAMDTAPDSVWPLTSNTALCRLCQYRSLCDRGREAGSLDDESGEYADPGDLVDAAPAGTLDEYVL